MASCDTRALDFPIPSRSRRRRDRLRRTAILRSKRCTKELADAFFGRRPFDLAINPCGEQMETVLAYLQPQVAASCPERRTLRAELRADVLYTPATPAVTSVMKAPSTLAISQSEQGCADNGGCRNVASAQKVSQDVGVSEFKWRSIWINNLIKMLVLRVFNFCRICTLK